MSTNNNQCSRHSYGLLADVKSSELTTIRVAVRRKIVNPQPPGPLIREIDDPRSIVPLVHIKKGISPRFKAIFDKQGVLVNLIDKIISPETIVCDSYSQTCCLNHCSAKLSKSRSRSLSIGRKRKVTKYDRRSAYSYERRNSSRYKSMDRDLPRHSSTDSDSPRHRSTYGSLEIKSTAKDCSKRNSEYRDSPPKRKSVDRYSHNQRSLDRGSPYRKSIDRERDRSRSYSFAREYRERKKSITPLKPGEYRPGHPDLKRKLGLDDINRTDSYPTTSSERRASNSIYRNRERYRSRRSRSTSVTYSKTHSRSPEHYKKRYHSPPEISPRSREYVKARRHRRSRSKSPQPNVMPHFGDPFRYHEGMHPANFGIHSGAIRPGFPMHGYYPPGFFSSGIPPVGSMMYPQRYPIIPPMTPPMIRHRFPIYNRQKPITEPVIEEDNANGNNSNTTTEKS